MRRDGEVKQEPKGKSVRPFGVASVKNLRRFAGGQTDAEMQGMARELKARDAGKVRRRENRGPDTPRQFEEAQTSTLRKQVKRHKDKAK